MSRLIQSSQFKPSQSNRSCTPDKITIHAMFVHCRLTVLLLYCRDIIDVRAMRRDVKVVLFKHEMQRKTAFVLFGNGRFSRFVDGTIPIAGDRNVQAVRGTRTRDKQSLAYCPTHNSSVSFFPMSSHSDGQDNYPHPRQYGN